MQPVAEFSGPSEDEVNRNDISTLRAFEDVKQIYFSPDFGQPKNQDRVLIELLQISKSSLFKSPEAQPIHKLLADIGKDPVLVFHFIEQLKSQNGNVQAMEDGLQLAEAMQLQSDPSLRPLLEKISNSLSLPEPLQIPTAPAKKSKPFWQKSKVWQTIARDALAVGALVGLGQELVNVVDPLDANPTPKPAAAAPANLPPRPIPVITGSPISLPEVVETQAPAPIEEPAVSSEPIPTPIVERKVEPNAEPTETPKRPEANLKGDILKDVFGPKLLAEAKKRNNELNTRDPERASRLNSEINKDRFTMLLLGMGSETDVQMTDTLLLLSYDVAHNKIQVISIPRDTYAPEVDQYKKAHHIGGDKFNAINTAFQTGFETAGSQGGFDLVRKSVEDSSGLEVHEILEVQIAALPKLVDSFTGPIKMNVDFSANLRDAHLGDPEHDGKNVVINRGIQEVDGNQMQELARFRADAYITDSDPEHEPGEIGRVHRLQKVIVPAVFKAIADKFKPKGDNPFAKGLDLISKAPDAKKLYDLIGEMQDKKLIQADSNIMSQVRDYTGTLVWAIASGASISVDLPPMEMMTFDEAHGLGSAGVITNKYRPDLRVAESPDIHDPSKADHLEPLKYWNKFRQATAKFILGN